MKINEKFIKYLLNAFNYNLQYVLRGDFLNTRKGILCICGIVILLCGAMGLIFHYTYIRSEEKLQKIWKNYVLFQIIDTNEELNKEIKNEGNNLEEYINVDEVLRYFAVNTFLVNLDSYASNMKHNYYIYERNGKMEVLPWDYNLSFGGYYLEKGSDVINFPIDTPVTHSVEKSPLIMKLLEVPEYKEKYHQYLKEIVNFYTENDRYKNIINNLDNN